MIEAVDLTRRFGEIVAVSSLNLTIEDGKVFGLLGPNGAGKTTTVRMLGCLIEPTDGTAYINGMDIRDKTERIRIRGMVGLLPETPGLYESLSAQRNLEFFARLYGVSQAESERRIRDLLKTLEVWDRRDDAVGKFSKGMRQKIAIARALVHEPEFLFLDEPTSGLDPQAAITVRNYLLDLRKEGRTLFINTHNLDEAERLCDTIGVIRGRLLDIGSPQELSQKFYGRTTVVHLRGLHPEMLAKLRSLPGVREVRELDGKLLVSLEDPERQNPVIVSTLVGMGAEVEFVNELRHGLEDVYLRLIEGS
jgi:ABC-2 type transport system ATP-binding protein